mmetsp:Transcript_37159/g.73595  ORF Transcript_37159/g.73595 Transcript_37159/m.73595 type:complete len:99 (+) Transcript_37159:98-394(+)
MCSGDKRISYHAHIMYETCSTKAMAGSLPWFNNPSIHPQLFSTLPASVSKGETSDAQAVSSDTCPSIPMKDTHRGAQTLWFGPELKRYTTKAFCTPLK